MWPKPSPRMKAAYLIHHFACASAVFWSSLLLPLVPGAAPYVVTLVWLAVTAYYVWWVKRYYESKAYYIDEDYVTVEKGVFFSVVQRVLISKIHLVSLSMGLISRLLGLATINLHTAAGSTSTWRGPGMPEVGLAHLDYDEVLRVSDRILELLSRLAVSDRRRLGEGIVGGLRRTRELLEAVLARGGR